MLRGYRAPQTTVQTLSGAEEEWKVTDPGLVSKFTLVYIIHWKFLFDLWLLQWCVENCQGGSGCRLTLLLIPLFLEQRRDCQLVAAGPKSRSTEQDKQLRMNKYSHYRVVEFHLSIGDVWKINRLLKRPPFLLWELKLPITF